LAALAVIGDQNKMSLTSDQAGVVRGIILGIFATLFIVFGGIQWNPFGYSASINLEARLESSVAYLAIPGLFLSLSIGRLAKRRFLSSKDINGSGLSVASDSAKILQALIQNTLEQTVLAVIAYFTWIVVMPSNWLSVVPLAAITFGLGRVIFFIGYKYGAPGRVLGFTLCFFPSVAILITVAGKYIWVAS